MSRKHDPSHFVHFRVDAATVADHAAAHESSPEEMGDVPCGSAVGAFADTYAAVTCPDCIAAGFGPEAQS